MKDSIKFLPERKQQDLKELVEIIHNTLVDCEMIILFGSYAKNNYVDYDQRIEFGYQTYFMSDYDILILTKEAIGINEQTIYRKIKNQFFQNKSHEFHTNPQLINEDLNTFKRQIEDGYYFYTDIRRQGIVLYNPNRYILPQPRKLNYSEIKKLAEEYFEDKFKKANSFVYLATCAYNINDFNMAAFQLHQAAENYIQVIPLVFILYGYKEHDIEFLIDKARTHTTEICKAFPRNTDEENRLFKLLQNSYVQARYRRDFVVTKKDINALMSRIEYLRSLCEQICKNKLMEYKKLS